jgi:hypothetical protein
VSFKLRRGQVCLKFGENLKITARVAEECRNYRFLFFKIQMRISGKCVLVESGVLQEALKFYFYNYRLISKKAVAFEG